MSFARYAAEWSGRPLRDVLAGMVGTFALIPEVIAFSFVAGVDPEVGLYASFVIGIVIAFCGGRPAMISGAAGSVALVAAALVHGYGLQYLLAATLLAGAIQIVFGLLRLEVLMRFVSRSVRTGFVNALAILIFSAQVPQMLGVSWHSYAMIALGLAIIYLAPRLTTVVPSPLICIVVLTAISFAVPMPLRTVADLGRLPDDLPALVLPHVPATLATLRIIGPYALAMAVVGLLESMMTASVVDDLTETTSSKRQECVGLGLANLAAGLFGGIAGCGIDRADGRQCPLWRAQPAVDAGGRAVPAAADGGAAPVGARGAGGGAGGDHDHGFDQHLLLGLAADAADASESVPRP